MRVAAVASLVIVAAALAGCNDPNAKRMWSRIEAQHAAADPPQLWSVAVEGQADNGRPVEVCTDSQLRDGFRTVTPSIAGRDCLRPGDTPAATGANAHYKCQLDGVDYGVSTALIGDRKSDFTTVSSIQPLNGGTASMRRLHYRALGACPAGWKVGDATNQKGAKVSAR